MKNRFRHSKIPGILLFSLALCLALTASVSAQRFKSREKRDPFLDLRTVLRDRAPKVNVPPPIAKRPPGLPGLLISEVTVTGVASRGDSKIAILKGVDKFTYLAQVGSKLFDGFVAQISASQVVFSREAASSRGGSKTSRVVKHLYTEDHQVK